MLSKFLRNKANLAVQPPEVKMQSIELCMLWTV